MTFTYWYAVILYPTSGGADPALWGPGLHDLPLRCVIQGDLAGVVSDWPGKTVSRSSDSVDPVLVVRHEQLIEQIMADVAVLPMRFGTILGGDERVQAVLAERQATLKADLAHVTGCVELGMRVLWNPPSPVTPVPEPAPVATPGAQYMARRAAEEQAQRAGQAQGQALAAELHGALRDHAIDSRLTVLQTERLLVSAAYLVRHEQTAAFLGAVERLRTAYAQLAFLCSGPWPPYHFMSA